MSKSVEHAHDFFRRRESPEVRRQPRVRGVELPWECGLVICAACGVRAVSVTQFPTIRRDMECPECGAMAMHDTAIEGDESNV